MTEDKVASALDAFIATFTSGEPEPKSHKSQSHERETHVDRDSQKEREGRRRGEGSRVESYININGSFGLTTTKPQHFRQFSRGQSGASRATRATREMRWHLDHGERVPRDLCAGCRRPITAHQLALDLADDNRVHFANGCDCLIQHGERWRRTAREVIAHFDHGPWGAIPDLPPASATVAGAVAEADNTTKKPTRTPAVSATYAERMNNE